MQSKQEITKTIIALESAALERWGNGDPYQEMRVDGLEALAQYYKTIWGQVHFDRFELLNPLVQVGGELAVLTFNYISYTGEKASRWNCTEVYSCADNRWQIIQTHWSYTRHPGIVQN